MNVCHRWRHDAKWTFGAPLVGLELWALAPAVTWAPLACAEAALQRRTVLKYNVIRIICRLNLSVPTSYIQLVLRRDGDNNCTATGAHRLVKSVASLLPLRWRPLLLVDPLAIEAQIHRMRHEVTAHPEV
jgi:hypothetical protein